MGSWIFKKIIYIIVLVAFCCTSVIDPQYAHAQTVSTLPPVGALLKPTSDFTPVIVRGLSIYPDDPMKFDFVVDAGTEQNFSEDNIRHESDKLIKYFLSALTIPDKDQWVNLSPYEEGRIVESNFGATQMGKDLLAQDYILKQLMASLSNPDDKLGQEFWDRVYSKASEQYGSTDIPLDMFNKVWIMPDKASVYETGHHVFVLDKHLKVMLESDYIAQQQSKLLFPNALVGNPYEKQNGSPIKTLGDDRKEITEETKNLIREILLPELEREVNEGAHFAPLRQIYNSMILATWFKMRLKESILGEAYADHKVVEGINDISRESINRIYHQYLEAYKAGVYDFIKEDYDPTSQQIIPRKYFSGGFSRMMTSGLNAAMLEIVTPRDKMVDLAQLLGKTKEVIVTFLLGSDRAMLSRRKLLLIAAAILGLPAVMKRSDFYFPLEFHKMLHTNLKLPSDFKIANKPVGYRDSYNAPPLWETYALDLNSPTDISDYRTMMIDLVSKGQRNIFVELIDESHLDGFAARESQSNFDPEKQDLFDRQRVISKIYSVSDSDQVFFIPMDDFLGRVDLTRISRINFYVGDHFFYTNLNPKPGRVIIKDVRFSKSENSDLPQGIDLESFKIQAKEKARVFESELQAKVAEGPNIPSEMFSEEREMLKGKGRNFDQSIEAIKKLENLAQSGNKDAIKLLKYELINPFQQLNLRRYIYYFLSEVLREPLDLKFIDDSILRSYWVTEPIVAEFPAFEDLKENVALDQSKEPKMLARVLDRRVMQRLAYWSLVMKIDPLKVAFPSIYMETRLGDHELKTYNIMEIHVSDLEAALPPEGKELRDVLLDKFGRVTFDSKLDRIIVTGLILMQDGFNTFPRGELDLRLQGYNGYGVYPWDPFKGKRMSEFPGVGRMVKEIGQRLPAVLGEIVEEVSEETGLSIPHLPESLSGFRIGIRIDQVDERLNSLKRKTTIVSRDSIAQDQIGVPLQDTLRIAPTGQVEIGQNFLTSGSVVDYRRDGERFWGTAARWQAAIIHLGGIDISNGQSLVFDLNMRKGARIVIQIIDGRQKHGEPGNDYVALISGSGRLQIDYKNFNNEKGEGVDWTNVQDIVIHYGPEYFEESLNRYETEFEVFYAGHEVDQAVDIHQTLWWTSQDIKNYLWGATGAAVSLIIAGVIYRRSKLDEERIKPQRKGQGKTLVNAKFRGQVVFATLFSLTWGLANSATNAYDFLIAFATYPILYNTYYSLLLALKGLTAERERISDEELDKDGQLARMAVLFPTYKEPLPVMKMTLDSLLNQDYPGEMVLVVIDNSFGVNEVVYPFIGEPVTAEDKKQKSNYDKWVVYQEWKAYVESQNGVNGKATMFIARDPEPRVKPVNIDLGITTVLERYPDIGFISIIDTDSTLERRAFHIGAHELNTDDKMGFVQMYTLSTNGHLNEFADKVAVTLSGQRLGTGLNSKGGYALCYGHNVVFTAEMARLLTFMDFDSKGRPMITEDFKVSTEAYLLGFYGKTAWVNAGEWVPFSPSGLDGMWRRWAFGGLQTNDKLAKRVKETPNMSRVEKDNYRQFVRWYLFQTLIPILSVASLFLPIPKGWVQLLIAAPLLNMAIYMKAVHPHIPGGERWQVWKYLAIAFVFSSVGQIFMDSNINNWVWGVSGLGLIIVAGRVLWASMLTSTLITWSVFVATIKFKLGMKEGWKVTNKGSEEEKTWGEFVKDYLLQLSYIALSLMAYSYRIWNDLRIVDFTQDGVWRNLVGIFLDTSPTLMYVGPLLAAILIYGRARLKEETNTEGADIQSLLKYREENSKLSWWKRFWGGRRQSGNQNDMGTDSAMMTKSSDLTTPVGGIAMDSAMLDLQRTGDLEPVNFTVQPDQIPKFDRLFHNILKIRIVTPAQLLSRLEEESGEEPDSTENVKQTAAVLPSREL